MKQTVTNRCTNEINIISHSYTIGMIKLKWDTLPMCDENFGFVQHGGKYKCQNRQSLRGIIHGCFKFVNT